MPSSTIHDLNALCAELRANTDPIEGVKLARRIAELATELEQHTVRAARQQGASWSRIGAVFGLSKQGAQQRFGKKNKGTSPTPDTSA